MAINFLTKPYGKGGYNDSPIVRISNNICYLNQSAVNILPAGTTHVDIGIDTEQDIIVIRESDTSGRKLSQPTKLGCRRFSCTCLTKAYPEVEKKCYRAENEQQQILLKY